MPKFFQHCISLIPVVDPQNILEIEQIQEWKGVAFLATCACQLDCFSLREEANSKSEINFDCGNVNNSIYKILSVYHVVGAF